MNLATISHWLESAGWQLEPVDVATVRIFRPSSNHRLFIRWTEHWVLLAIVPLLPRGAAPPADLSRRLLFLNRDIRLAKFAYDEDGDAMLAAELPTESLDPPELHDAVERMVAYVDYYAQYLSRADP